MLIIPDLTEHNVDELEGYCWLDVLRHAHGLKRSVLMNC